MSLESLSVEEYYQTIATWLKIIDEKNKTVDKLRSSEDSGSSSESGSRKKFSGGK